MIKCYNYKNSKKMRTQHKKSISWINAVLFVISGIVMALYAMAVIIQFQIVNISDENIRYFRNNYGELSSYSMLALMIIILGLSLIMASKRK